MMINRKKFDFVLLGLLILLILIGCIAIYSASTTVVSGLKGTQNYWWRQIIFAVVALVGLMLVLWLPMPIFDILILPAFIANILALIMVLFTPAVSGAHRWFSIGGIHFQPSESAKLLSILVIARNISRDGYSDYRKMFNGFAIMLIPIMLIMIQPDIGTIIVFFVSLIAMLVAADVPLFYILLILSPAISVVASIHWLGIVLWLAFLIGILILSRLSWVTITVAGIGNAFVSLVMPVLWMGLKDYQQNRILTFLDPTRDPLGAGYQIIQSKIAIGSGSIFGKGWLGGTQKNMNFLPEHHTDFIFSTIGEEFGFFGSIILLGVFAFFFARMIRAASELKVLERKVATSGIFAYLISQSFINIGMNIG
ncbi:MAG: rod shape-determining protein RodA, partial [Candidatus Cloacimonetes bacterium]|nr:rod shape-determining protein RodA [Candidatus Cloacimonadota bacterium]